MGWPVIGLSGEPSCSETVVCPLLLRKRAMDEANEKAAKSGASTFIVYEDTERTYRADAPPPGSMFGGVYHVYSIFEIRFIELTRDSLLAELKNAVSYPVRYFGSSHLRTLIEIAKKPEYRALTQEYRNIVRSINQARLDGDVGNALVSLVALIGANEGDHAAEDLTRWAKFHAYAPVRVAAYRALIDMKKTREVEEMLRSEENTRVKDEVKRLLI